PTSRLDEFVEPTTRATRILYACPNLHTSQRLVQLDIPTPTFTRAPGEASGSFGVESALDELAWALKLDPVELRLRNHADRDPEEDKPWGSKSLRECYRAGAERFGWSKRPDRVRATRDGHLLIGWGMATAAYPAGQRDASALARLRPDGTVLVQVGSQDLGTGTYTIMTQIAADALGLPPDRVRFELGDTQMPEAPGSGGSTTASTVGPAVKMACEALRARLVEMSRTDARSPLSGLAPDAIDVVDGALVARAEPSRRDPLAELLRRSGKDEVTERVESKATEARKAFSHYAFGAQFVEVAVDEDLGEVRVRRAVGAFACGKILNAKTARSQLVGGIIWGIGMALHEHTVRDERTGRVVTRDLADYHVPVNLDIPAIEIITIDEVDPHVNPIGAKGLGEIGITGVAAAIASAIYHATGRRLRDLPMTPDRLLGLGAAVAGGGAP
ncbi:MAG: xanthine dehydrogenase family protein molybdopterin-binding subunit, partial [Myxococcales bacterium]